MGLLKSEEQKNFEALKKATKEWLQTDEIRAIATFSDIIIPLAKTIYAYDKQNSIPSPKKTKLLEDTKRLYAQAINHFIEIGQTYPEIAIERAHQILPSINQCNRAPSNYASERASTLIDGIFNRLYDGHAQKITECVGSLLHKDAINADMQEGQILALGEILQKSLKSKDSAIKTQAAKYYIKIRGLNDGITGTASFFGPPSSMGSVVNLLCPSFQAAVNDNTIDLTALMAEQETASTMRSYLKIAEAFNCMVDPNTATVKAEVAEAMAEAEKEIADLDRDAQSGLLDLNSPN